MPAISIIIAAISSEFSSMSCSTWLIELKSARRVSCTKEAGTPAELGVFKVLEPEPASTKRKSDEIAADYRAYQEFKIIFYKI